MATMLPPYLRPLVLALLFSSATLPLAQADPLPDTQPLELTGDISAKMVEGIDHWLDRETAHTAEERARTWQAATKDAETWKTFTTARREELRQMLGIVDKREAGLMEHLKTAGTSDWIMAAGKAGKLHPYPPERVRWPVFPGVSGEGALFRPDGEIRGVIILVPDADQIPEHAPDAYRLTEQGWLVLAPVLVDRRDNWSSSELLQRVTNQPGREWIYRQGFEMGRTIIGYEAQKIFASLDALAAPDSPFAGSCKNVAIVGYGEGGLLALVCAALDERIKATMVAGYFGPHERLYIEPIYRNVFGLHRNFGNAELAALMAPRPLFVSTDSTPQVSGPPTPDGKHRGAAPGAITAFTAEEVVAEKTRADAVLSKLSAPTVVVASEATEAQSALLKALGSLAPDKNSSAKSTAGDPTQEFIDSRQQRTVRELTAFTQDLVPAEEEERTTDVWNKVKPGADWDAIQHALHDRLWKDCIGKIEAETLPPNAHTRLLYEKEKFRVYEVTLDVFPDVFAWGWLLVPKDIKPREKRPVVVCQHGLEGVPEDVVNDDPKWPAFHYYQGFASKLAEQGFVTYAPHNPYRGQDKFRVLQRKANPLGLSLFSFILAQHDVTTKWLAGLPFVDPQRIAFYGLSYGGKTAMRVPALLDRYCLSICSGDFNEWVRKCVSTTYRGTYMVTPEYEMPEWNLANVANYGEMAMLIAPRPFMVERGHKDGVGLDEWVGYEYAKVRRGYDQLGIGDRTTIEWFDGPHMIHGVGTFEFLHQHLAWPAAK